MRIDKDFFKFDGKWKEGYRLRYFASELRSRRGYFRLRLINKFETKKELVDYFEDFREVLESNNCKSLCNLILYFEIGKKETGPYYDNYKAVPEELKESVNYGYVDYDTWKKEE